MSEQIIAIGALGGSGTRAIAELFLQYGLFLGDDLNDSNDNLLFTRLFKNPEWYRNSSAKEKTIRFDIFNKCMTGKHLTTCELNELFFAVESNLIQITDFSYFKAKFESEYKGCRDLTSWGWKEPNTQIYVSELLEYFEGLKYIHVIRHGLDMAFSDNIQQLSVWGWKYGITLSKRETASQIAVKQLDYWIETTKEILNLQKDNKAKILILNHTSICINTKMEIDRMLDFCGLKLESEMLHKLYQIPKDTGSNNRYKKYDLSIFRSDQLEFVKYAGFLISSS